MSSDPSVTECDGQKMISGITRKTGIIGSALRTTLNRAQIQREYCFYPKVYISECSLFKPQFVRKYSRKSCSDRQAHQCVLFQVKAVKSLEN